ncbi:MAG TPA: hypothetical protein VGW12_00730 [Pyrinomonadaceae bacterium]|nr:hypothetical protein [Pyrinomonadaceae bacterium]
MSETTNILKQQALLVDVSAGSRPQQQQGASREYYNAYYRELVARGASRAERNRRLEAIKTERRRVRREKWLRGIKSLASVLVSSEALSQKA